MKDSFYNEIEHESDQFPKHQMNILLGDFNAEVERGDISNQHLGMRVYMK
jgi:hypothetical protein